jgi:2-aminoadipate transaminase
MAQYWTLARRADKMNPSVIRENLKVTERAGITSFAGGLPSARTFPKTEFAAALRQELAEPSDGTSKRQPGLLRHHGALP